MSAGATVPKESLFRSLGFGGDRAPYEEVLRAAGLSRPEKAGIQASKEEAVRAALEERFLPVCGRGDCREEAAADGRTLVPASEPRHCALCGGSANQRAVEGMVAACGTRRWRRICVVGGSPNARRALGELVGGRLDLRLVDGTASRNSNQAAADLSWADVVVIWGGTQLDHRVSQLYKGGNVIALARRSIQEMARAVVRAADGGR
jgi:hypothetical protein